MSTFIVVMLLLWIDDKGINLITVFASLAVELKLKCKTVLIMQTGIQMTKNGRIIQLKDLCYVRG